MSVTLYFSKININSHIFDIYDNPSRLKEILNLLMVNINNDIKYEKNEIRYDESGDVHEYNASYKFSSIEKLGDELDNVIVGNVIKTSNLFINKVNEKTGHVKKVPVENNEVIRFCFDIFNEKVAFYTTNRFGYVEFNDAFRELINISMEEYEDSYSFEAFILRKGLNIEEIRSELKSIGRIETLKIEIIPPNPNEDLLNQIYNNGEKFLQSAKAGNVTSRSILFTSKAPNGLLLDSSIVKDEIDQIENIHSRLSSEEAISKGYATVEAVSKSGRTYSTKNNQPIKDKIDDYIDNVIEFAKVCKRIIKSV
ncbi:DUF4747 domain-containing protein [Clostridium sp. JS66]|uniref:DUF4747 domain-containing protein n=1 Tax=Clostridium sp. JS66 TaxID=3064705 RepID=UPI00298ECC2C|nr:DUF4747 domain-containing protein [Clostridium sp. JS66]WPC42381.1 DUF4747 domain-containing protein [Clostridium sp. JS66]